MTERDGALLLLALFALAALLGALWPFGQKPMSTDELLAEIIRRAVRKL